MSESKQVGFVPLPRAGVALSHAIASIRDLQRHCQFHGLFPVVEPLSSGTLLWHFGAGEKALADEAANWEPLASVIGRVLETSEGGTRE